MKNKIEIIISKTTQSYGTPWMKCFKVEIKNSNDDLLTYKNNMGKQGYYDISELENILNKFRKEVIKIVEMRHPDMMIYKEDKK